MFEPEDGVLEEALQADDDYQDYDETDEELDDDDDDEDDKQVEEAAVLDLVSFVDDYLGGTLPVSAVDGSYVWVGWEAGMWHLVGTEADHGDQVLVWDQRTADHY